LAQRQVDQGSSPSRRLLREEVNQRVRAALSQLGERDREVLVMRYLEQMTNPEIAAALGLTEGAVKMRHLRAMDDLRRALVGEIGEETL
jgi:RNA polymerase sigma-70 factor (ECF subfamily)